jgi:hypothetical protein
MNLQDQNDSLFETIKKGPNVSIFNLVHSLKETKYEEEVTVHRN